MAYQALILSVFLNILICITSMNVGITINCTIIYITDLC